MKSFNTVDIVEEFLSKYTSAPVMYPSSKEIKQKRPKVEFSAGAVVREMRNEREKRLLGL